MARIRVAVADTVPDLVPAGSRERLTGRPSGQEFHISSCYQLGDFSHAIWITQVPVQRKAAEVMTMRLECFRIAVNRKNHTVTRRIQPKAQAACPAEEVRCQVRTFGAQPGRIGQECVRVCAFVSMGS
jgi:hypothetical protein